MFKTNEKHLIMLSVSGEIAAPRVTPGVYRVDREGKAYLYPGEGGICYNVKMGDPAFGWIGDNAHPGVAVYHESEGLNGGLNYLSCIGNTAVVTSGEALGAEGIVIGKHGFVDGLGLLDMPYIIVHFNGDILEKLAIGDKVQVKSFGRELAIDGYPDVRVKNCSPDLLKKLGIEADNDGILRIPVAAKIPVRMMGEGTDHYSERSAQSIMGGRPEQLAELGLDKLRLGDVVALLDQDHSFGRAYVPGALSIGVVVHGDSPMGGHGPGVTTLLACGTSRLEAVLDPKANITEYLGLRTMDLKD